MLRYVVRVPHYIAIVFRLYLLSKDSALFPPNHCGVLIVVERFLIKGLRC
nr:MAG TPA: hypothetical protein [Bacteriophage sp.]